MKRFDWDRFRVALILRGAFAVLLVLLCILGTGCFWLMFGQNVNAASPQADTRIMPLNPFMTGTTMDPWFWILVAGWLFSCVVSGMPEPDRNSSPWYVWAYRSLRLITASGTAYFQHRSMWPEMKTRVVPIEDDNVLPDSKQE